MTHWDLHLLSLISLILACGKIVSVLLSTEFHGFYHERRWNQAPSIMGQWNGVNLSILLSHVHLVRFQWVKVLKSVNHYIVLMASWEHSIITQFALIHLFEAVSLVLGKGLIRRSNKHTISSGCLLCRIHHAKDRC